MSTHERNLKEEIAKDLKKGNDRIKTLGHTYNPVLEEIRDPDQLQYSIYGMFDYVPFLDGCDATFKFFERMSQLSPTHGSCINNIGVYCTGGGFSVVRKDDGFSDTDEADVTDSERAEFKAFLKEWTSTKNLMDAVKEVYASWKIWGNAYLEVIITKVAGKEFITYKSHDADRVRYMATDPNNPNKFVFISALWDVYYLSKYSPQVVPVYPNFSDEENGVRRTVIHLKNKVAGRTWYGMPNSSPSIYSQYLEYQSGLYKVEGYDKAWSAKVYLDYEADLEDEEDTEKIDRRFDEQFSNRGGIQKQIIRRARTPGTAAAYLHEFTGNTDHEFHASNVDIAERQIYKSHDWHPILSQKTAGSMGNSNEFREVFKLKFFTVIQPTQEEILSPFRTVCDIAAQILGYPNEGGLTLGLQSLFADLLIAEEAQNTNPDAA